MADRKVTRLTAPIVTSLIANGTGWTNVGGSLGSTLDIIVGRELVDQAVEGSRVNSDGEDSGAY